MGAAEQAAVRDVLAAQPGLFRLTLEVEPRLAQACAAGRYLMLRVGFGSDPYLPRPLWARRTAANAVSLIVQVQGSGTLWLAGRRPGDRVELYGPLGTQLALPPRTQRLLLTGDLQGMNCLLALADEALARSVEVAMVLYPAPSEGVVRLLPPDVELLSLVDADALQWADALYCAGGTQHLAELQGVLRSSGSRVPAHALVHTPLACGVGACYGCRMETRKGARLACLDGPAFPLRELVWT